LAATITEGTLLVNLAVFVLLSAEPLRGGEISTAKVCQPYRLAKLSVKQSKAACDPTDSGAYCSLPVFTACADALRQDLDWVRNDLSRKDEVTPPAAGAKTAIEPPVQCVPTAEHPSVAANWLFPVANSQRYEEKTCQRAYNATELASRAHRTYIRMKRWNRTWQRPATATEESGNDVRARWNVAVRAANDVERLEAQRAIEDLANAVHHLMGETGVRTPVSGLLVAGLALPSASEMRDSTSSSNASTSGSSSGSTTADEAEASNGGTEQTAPNSYVLFETRRAFSDLGPVTISAGGRIGFAPVLTIVEETPATNTSEASPAPGAMEGSASAQGLLGRYQNGFVWEFGPRINCSFSSWLMVTAFASAGQSRVTAKGVVLDTNTIGLPAEGTNGRTRWSTEYGLKLRLFGGNAVDENVIMSPPLELSVARRRDNRFRGDDRLAAFADPESRWVLRFALNALSVAAGLGDDDPKERPFSLTFGVEYEGPWKRSGLRIASGTKFLIRGDVDFSQLKQRAR
jgi:hypothetical protein